MKAKLTCILICVVLGWFTPAGAGQHPAVETAVNQAREAGISEDTLNRMLTAGYRYSVAPEDMAQWITITRNAAKEGLPYTHLVDKLQEGLSKRIPAERINRVLERLLMQMRIADRLVRQSYSNGRYASEGLSSEGHSSEGHDSEGHDSEGAVGRVTDLMMTGLTEQEIQTLMGFPGHAGLKQRIEAATFFTVLKQTGLGHDPSMHIVSEGLQNNFFNSFPVELAFTIKAAHAQKIQGDRISGETLKVVTRQQTERQMQNNLHLGPIRQPGTMPGKQWRGGRGPFRFGPRTGSGGSGSGDSGSGGGGKGSGGHSGGKGGHGGGRGGGR